MSRRLNSFYIGLLSIFIMGSMIAPVRSDAVSREDLSEAHETSNSVSGNAPDLKWRGGDISMVPKFEELGAQYRVDGKEGDPVRIMMDKGMNLFRVRLFVNPNMSNAVIQDLAYVTALGQRIKKEGAVFLLDIHYSDTWADPQHQLKPVAWEGLSFNQLEAQVETYSSNVIATLKAAGCLPDMVQVGNEIRPGMIWPDGHLDSPQGGWKNLAALLKAGIRGVEQPLERGEDMKIMIHYDRSGDTQEALSFYGQLAKHDIEYDIIGLSYYPWYHGPLANVENTLGALAKEFGKPIVIVEAAYPWKQIDEEESMDWPQTPAGQAQFMKDLSRVVRVTPGGLGKGIIWWYPEAVRVDGLDLWLGGATALFDSSGNALPALEVF